MGELLYDWLCAILFIISCLIVVMACIVIFICMTVMGLIHEAGKLWDLALGIRTREDD